MKKLSEMEQNLLYFILNNEDFFNLAKKYTFIYREFTPFVDYCKIKWNLTDKKFEFVEYYCHNKNKKMLQEEVLIFYLDLNIDGFNWGTLLSELEFQFERSLEENLEEIDKSSARYKEMKSDFFQLKRDEIIYNFFKLNETTIADYFQKILKKLRHQRFEQVNRLMH